MKVSVIIPLYNKARFVVRALDSIYNQTLQDFELIIVDDGSTDSGPEIVRAQASRFENCRIITQPNAGPGAARNRGISEAAGEFVAFLDADDEWLPDYLEKSVAVLEAYGPELATVSSGYFEYPSGKSTEEYWKKRGIQHGPFRLTSETTPADAISKLAYMSPWSTVSRRTVLNRWGGFFARNRCKYAEDAFLWLKVLLNEQVAFLTEPLVNFHTEASQLSRNSAGPRPVEPFLQYPGEIEKVCPPELKNLLAEILAARAIKTACVLGYWGNWREARELMERFAVPQPWRLPNYIPGLVCTTPVGDLLGRSHRVLQRLTAGVHS